MSKDPKGNGCLLEVLGAIVLFFVWLIIATHISDTRAPRTAETLGFTNVEVQSSTIWFTQFRGCGVDNMKLWRVTGVNPQGQHVKFLVCGDIFSNTLRVK